MFVFLTSSAGHLALVRGVTAVSPVSVLLFAGPNRMPVEVVTEADAAAHGNPYLEETSDSEERRMSMTHEQIECAGKACKLFTVSIPFMVIHF